MTHRRYIQITALALGLALVGCSNPTGTGEGTGKAKEGGTVTVALAEAPDKLDPTVASTFVGRIVFANMCEKLYDVNEDLELVPQLAADMPEISEDGKTYTFDVREGVKFNDGTELNAAAVKKTLEHYQDAPESARSAELSEIDSIETEGDTTVRLNLKHPFAPLTSIFADRSGMILSPKQLDELGADFANDPVCVGPFSFKDRPSSDRIELTKSDHYYDKSDVKLDGVNFSVITQGNVRAANLRSGDIDIADRIEPTDIETLKSVDDIKISPVTSLGYQGITVNVANSNGSGKLPHNIVDKPLAQEPKLREAFALSLDRKAINKVVFDGQYTPGCTPISPVTSYAPDIECPEQDLARAKQLVKETGVKTPVKITLTVEAANPEATKLGTVIQGMAKKAGFQVKVQSTEFTTALEQSQAGKLETFQVGWSGRLDPDQNIAPFWDPRSTLGDSGANYDDVMDLIAKERATTDGAERKQIFNQLTQKFLEYNNVIYLYHPKVVLGNRTSLSGVEYYGDGLIRLKTATQTG
ncbi:MAG: ABC transporter substrate-binding protein [Streptosporangiales bacterium]|nr:ABC transporter substrate-binding protein [Streptosporangiales bacterium]